MNFRSIVLYVTALVLLASCRETPAPQTQIQKEAAPEITMPKGLAVTSEGGVYVIHEGQPGMPRVVLISGDEEYRSEEAMPMMAKILTKHHRFNTAVLFAQDPSKNGLIDGNYGSNIAGLETLKNADLMIIFTRFRHLADHQMALIDDYLKSGKPVIGIRTSTHAFAFKDEAPDSKWAHYGNFYEGDDEWNGGFGRLVLGEKWISHHGHHRHQSARGVIAPGAMGHPIMKGIESGEIWGPTDVYGVRLPLPGDSEPIVLGQVVNRKADYDENDALYGMRDTDTEVAITNPQRKDVKNINDPMMPIAWTKSYTLPGGKSGKSFTSTIGAATDLLNAPTRRMFVNATYWILGMSVPDDVNVDIIGKYDPSPYKFVDDAYWVDMNMHVADMK